MGFYCTSITEQILTDLCIDNNIMVCIVQVVGEVCTKRELIFMYTKEQEWMEACILSECCQI